MKKILTMITLYCAALQTANSQITMTSASGFVPGDSYSIQQCDADLITISDAGANVNVDFSSLVNDGAPIVTSFVNPAGTPYASSFPTATVANSTISGQGVTAYAYYTNTSTALSVIGIASPQYTMTYQNPALQFKFPTQYNDTIYDEFEASYSANGVDVKRFGTIATKADAYGNITTPHGTFPYLRLYTVQTITDTFIMDGNIIGLSYSETYSYNYMNDQFKGPIFAYSEVYTGQGDASSAYYNVSPVTGLNETNMLTSKETVYPNPVSTGITTLSFELKSAEKLSFEVYDIHGKLVQTIQQQLMNAGSHNLPIDVSTLSPGFYSVQIATEQQGNKAVKFVVK
jgi:hypothetical protein